MAPTRTKTWDIGTSRPSGRTTPGASRRSGDSSTPSKLRAATSSRSCGRRSGRQDFAPFVSEIDPGCRCCIRDVHRGRHPPLRPSVLPTSASRTPSRCSSSEDLVAQDAIRFYSGDAATGIVGITPFTANLDRPEMQTFVQAYRRPDREHSNLLGRVRIRRGDGDRSDAPLREEENDIAVEDLPEWIKIARGGLRSSHSRDRPLRCPVVSNHRGRIQPAGEGLLHRGAGGRRRHDH